MAKLPFPTNDEYNPNPDTPPPLAGPATGPRIGTPNASWFNVTRGTWTITVPADAIICPPGGYQYYEPQDPLGTLCLNKYTPRVPSPDDAPAPRTDPVPPPAAPAINPTISYTPYVDPPNTFRATSVRQMYTWYTPDGPFGADWLFHVGVPHGNPTRKFYLFNRSVNTRLQCTANLPSYVQLLGVENTFEVPSLTYISFEVAFNELAARELSKTANRNYSLSLIMDIYPMAVTGPVFVGNTEYTFEQVTGTSYSDLPVASKWWFNMTQNIYTPTKPENAYVCPPGSNQYYEIGDEDGPRCLAGYSNTPPTTGGGIIVRPPVAIAPNSGPSRSPGTNAGTPTQSVNQTIIDLIKRRLAGN